jgi:hypothetical protein
VNPADFKRMQELLEKDESGLMKRFEESLRRRGAWRAAEGGVSEILQHNSISNVPESPLNIRVDQDLLAPPPAVPPERLHQRSVAPAITRPSDLNEVPQCGVPPRAAEVPLRAPDAAAPRSECGVAGSHVRTSKWDLAVQCAVEMKWNTARRWLSILMDWASKNPDADGCESLPDDIVSIAAIVLASRTWMQQQSSWSAGRTNETAILASTIFYRGAYESWWRPWSDTPFTLANIRDAADELRDWIARMLELDVRLQLVEEERFDSSRHEWQGGQAGTDRILPASFCILGDRQSKLQHVPALVRPYNAALFHEPRDGA